jgi:hypothetical protein
MVWTHPPHTWDAPTGTILDAAYVVWQRLISQTQISRSATRSKSSLAAALGIAEAMVKKQLHNLRQRYRWLLRDEVAQTLENPGVVDDEIRHLCAVLATESGR